MFGKPLEVGTKVVYIRNSKTSWSAYCATVVGFTPKMVRISTPGVGHVKPSSLLGYDWTEEKK